MYAADLAYIHHAGFGDVARRAAPEIVAILRGHGIRSGRIVEAGCGSGIVARALTDAGYRVRGFDASPAMIRLARSNAPGAAFEVGTIASASIARGDAVIAIGEIINYTRSWRTVARFVRRVSNALRPGGLFVFDFIASAERRTFAPKTVAGDDWALLVRADLSDRGRVLTRRMTIVRRVAGRYQRSREVHRVHVWPSAKVESALVDAGFAVRLRHSYGRYRLLPGDVAVVAQRR